MKEQINWLTSAQANECLYEWLVKLLQPEGFTEHAAQANILLRVKEHYIQMVRREIREEESIIKLIVAPMWTYRDSWCFGRNIHLKYDDSVAHGRNNYTILAYKQETSPRVFYKQDELIRVWDASISPQLCGEVIGFYNGMCFGKYIQYCEEEDGKTWDFGYTDCESRLFTRGYNCLWKKEYGKGVEYLEEAVRESEKYLLMLEAWGEQAAPEYLRDLSVGKDMVELIHHKEPGWEGIIHERLECLEKDVLEKKFHL